MMQLIAGLSLMLISILATYAFPSSITTSPFASRCAGAKRQILAAIRSIGSDEPVVPMSYIPTTPAALRDIVQEAAFLARWGPILRPDYALGADGARIVSSLTSSQSNHARARPPASTIGPEVVIDEELSVGRCWLMSVSGQLGLSTPTVIYPQYVTIDHIPRQIAIDIGRAPRHLILWGVVDGQSNLRRFRSLSTHDAFSQVPVHLASHGRSAPLITANLAFAALAIFEYDIASGWPTQTFPVFEHIRDSQMDFGVFVLEVVDNWGGSDTCLYRVRIHGEPAVIASQREH
ncbi:hypothetical protein VTO73DRAFT_7031 [Trametes versicolor]